MFDPACSPKGVSYQGMLLSGDLRASAGLRGFRPEDDLLGLSRAHLEMRNVAVSGTSAGTWGGRGDVSFSGGTLRVGPHPQLDGFVTLDARDARPLLAVLFGDGLPGILVRATDVPRLLGSARVIVQPDRLGILDLSVGGGDVALRGDYGTAVRLLEAGSR
jgi:hypothetical protein